VKRVVIYTALAALVGLTAGTANAQSSEVTEERQMTLPEGRAFVQAFFEMSMSTDAVFKPFSIAPDLWYGVNDALTVGLVHSGRAATGFLGGAGEGLCLAGTENNCAKVYNSVGVDARYHFYREGNLTAAADGGLYLASFDPLQAQLKVGAIGRWQGGALSLEVAPSLFAGLTEREPEAEDGVAVAAGTNKEIFFLPVTVMYALSPKFGLAGQVGVVLPFNETGDTYTIPVSVGGQFMVTDKIAADAAFSLPFLAGGELVETGADARAITVGVSYAM
jgi:hypothetical protein